MNICLLTTSYPRNVRDDAGIFIKRLVDAFSAGGESGQVIVPLDDREPLLEKEGNFSVQRFRYGLLKKGRLAFGAGIFPNIRRNPFLLLQAPGLIVSMAFKAFSLRKDFEVIHANWAASGISGWLASLMTAKPLVITLRGEDIKVVRKRLLKPLFSLVFKKAAAITSVNSEFLSILKDEFGLPEDKLFFIPNGVSCPKPKPGELQKFCQKKNFSPEGRYLLFVGHLIPRKRIEMLLALLSLPELSGFKLLLCGAEVDAPYGLKLREQVERLGLKDKVHFEGQVPPEEIPFYISIARWYVTASEFEGRPNSVLEALCLGLPVLASDIPSHREIINDGANGLLFSGSDISALASKISLAQPGSALYESMRISALESVKDMTWEKTREQYLKCFATVQGTKTT